MIGTCVNGEGMIGIYIYEWGDRGMIGTCMNGEGMIGTCTKGRG